jgi:hypothetical protein
MTLIGHAMMCKQAAPKATGAKGGDHATVIRWPVNTGLTED